MEEKIASLQDTIGSMDTKINDLISSLEQKAKAESQKLLDAIANIETHLNDVLNLDFDRFKVGR